MPLLVVAALVVSGIITPSGYRKQIFYYLPIALVVGVFGTQIFEPPEPFPHILILLVIALLFAKWFFMGYMISWGIGALATPVNRISQRRVACVVFTLAAIPLSLTLFDWYYLPGIYQRDRAYWDSVFSGQAAPEQLSFVAERLSSKGRDRVDLELRERPNEISAPVLTELHKFGFNVLAARNTPPEILKAVISDTFAKMARASDWLEKARVMPNFHLITTNPNLDEETLRMIVVDGDKSLVAGLIRTYAADKNRLAQLREAIDSRVKTIEAGHPTSNARNDLQWFLANRDELDARLRK